MVIETVLLAITAAIMYAGTQFIKKNMDPEHPEDFNGGKFGTTIVIGASVGLVFGYSGLIPSESMVLELMAYSGMTAIIENVMKIAGRWIKWLKGAATTDAGQ